MIERTQAALAVTLPADTVDIIKAGDTATVVTGIATTFIPTMAVLRKAVTDGDNLVITHEPSFFNHRDDPSMFVGDPVYNEKVEYIRDHHLVLFRLQDGWHLRKPDGIAEGWVPLPRQRALRQRLPPKGRGNGLTLFRLNDTSDLASTSTPAAFVSVCTKLPVNASGCVPFGQSLSAS